MRLIGRYGIRGRYVVDRWVRIGRAGTIIEECENTKMAQIKVRRLNLDYNKYRFLRAQRRVRGNRSEASP